MSTLSPSPQAQHGEWRNYADQLSASHSAFLPEIKSFFRNLPLGGARRLLDVPCGDGFYSLLFADYLESGSEVVAVDVDTEPLKIVERRAESVSRNVRITACSADIFSMPFGDGEMDFAWCAQSLISLSEPKETLAGPSIKCALREIYRVLRPGGQIGLLEQDAAHTLLLPWPADLELALHHAERLGFARLYGRPQQLDVGRHLAALLAESGFHPLRRLTLSADRIGTPNGSLHQFLKAYFKELRNRVHGDLGWKELRQFDRLTDPGSGNSFFHDPNFEMTWLEFVVLGLKP